MAAPGTAAGGASPAGGSLHSLLLPQAVIRAFLPVSSGCWRGGRVCRLFARVPTGRAAVANHTRNARCIRPASVAFCFHSTRAVSCSDVALPARIARSLSQRLAWRGEPCLRHLPTRFHVVLIEGFSMQIGGVKPVPVVGTIAADPAPGSAAAAAAAGAAVRGEGQPASAGPSTSSSSSGQQVGSSGQQGQGQQQGGSGSQPTTPRSAGGAGGTLMPN
jgi:hypothetical protein